MIRMLIFTKWVDPKIQFQRPSGSKCYICNTLLLEELIKKINGISTYAFSKSAQQFATWPNLHSIIIGNYYLVGSPKQWIGTHLHVQVVKEGPWGSKVDVIGVMLRVRMSTLH